MKSNDTVNAKLHALGGMDILSRSEIGRLRDASGNQLALLRRCALAVLTSGSQSDDPRAAGERYPDFDIRIEQQDRGLKLDLLNAPPEAFVDGQIIRGIHELLFAVVRDIAYVASDIQQGRFDLADSNGITNAVFEILRNARILKPKMDPNLVVCWGGHSIARHEYSYTKTVGYQLGLRGFDICTGCGPGAMKGPMKGATIGHAKQRIKNSRYIGITEPGIIAAESPNPIVNHLVIMPDIEKRLEAFVRCAHGIVVFPGGVGTAEEILYLLGILLHQENADEPLPMILTGPTQSKAYFEQIDAFLKLCLGEQAASRYQIVVNDPERVAKLAWTGVQKVRSNRINGRDAFFYNWSLKIDESLQKPFAPTHDNMRSLRIHRDLPKHELAAELRRLFSGIVAGNVKEEGIRAIEKHGPFEVQGEPEIMHALDALLASFVEQHRMKLPGGSAYQPCYRLVK